MQIDENGYWQAYQRVKENEQNGIASSDNDLLLASIYSEKMCNKVFYNNEDSIFTDINDVGYKFESDIFREQINNTFSRPNTKEIIKNVFPDTYSEEDFDDCEDTDINSNVSNKEFKKTEDLTDEELLMSVQTCTKAASMISFDYSEPVKTIKNCLLAYYAEGLSRNPNFFEGMEEDIQKAFDEMKSKIAELEEREKKLFDNEKSRNVIEEIFGDEDNDIDTEYKYLADHITWLLSLSNGTKLSRFGNGSYGDTMFNLRINGKTYLARYKKLEDGSEKVYINKGKGNFEEQIFDNEGNLKEKTVKTENKTVKEEFFENGVKFKTTTENLHDGSIKINKERKFPNGTVMKYEKIIKPEAANTDKRDNFTFSQDKVKGNCDLVDQDGSITGKITAETLQESKAKTKKNIKTAKNNSKSNINS